MQKFWKGKEKLIKVILGEVEDKAHREQKQKWDYSAQLLIFFQQRERIACPTENMKMYAKMVWAPSQLGGNEPRLCSQAAWSSLRRPQPADENNC